MGDYKKLKVWQLSWEFADAVERMARTLPVDVRRRAQEQLVPAAHAIHENLAEGCGFDSDRQLLKYTRQALATANESEDELLALDRQELLGGFSFLLEQVRRICAMLAMLRRKLEADIARDRSVKAEGRKPRRFADRRAASRDGKPNADAGSQGP